MPNLEKLKNLLCQTRCMGMNCNYVDNHIYKKDGRFFLFTSYMKDWKMMQELFVSENLIQGEFKQHPSSPICISHEYGRNAGSLIDYDGKLLRVSQDCHKDYGDNVSLHQITQLSEDKYEERLYLRNIYSGNPLFYEGGHQLNIQRFRGSYIYATDYKINKWTWWHLIHSLYKYLKL